MDLRRVAPGQSPSARDCDAVHVVGEQERLRTETGQYGYPDYPDGALRTTAPQLARHLGMVMGGGFLARPPSPVGGHGPGAAAGPGAWTSSRARDSIRSSYRERTWVKFSVIMADNMGVATVGFFHLDDDVGVVVLANGGWRPSRGDYPGYEIMDRLFVGGPPGSAELSLRTIRQARWRSWTSAPPREDGNEPRTLCPLGTLGATASATRSISPGGTEPPYSSSELVPET